MRTKFLDAVSNRILQAPAPERAFQRSSVDASLLAQVIVEKCVDYLPLHRQLNRYVRLGVAISGSTIEDWLSYAAALIQPLYQAHKSAVINYTYLHADETTIKVLDRLKKGTTHGVIIGFTRAMKLNLFYLITSPDGGEADRKIY